MYRMYGEYKDLTPAQLKQMAADLVARADREIAAAKVQRGQQIIRRVCMVLGFKELPTDRKSKSVLAKNMIAYQMCKEGYSENYIGIALGGYNHSSVWHMKKRMQDFIDYPEVFRYEAKAWNEFQKLLEYET